MTDPLSTYEAAESEAVDRQDEAMREEHWREAEADARGAISLAMVYGGGDCPRDYVRSVLGWILEKNQHALPFRVLADFEADYGTPALLRVIANALENSK